MRIAMTIVSIGMTIVSITLFAAEPTPPKSRAYSVSVSQHDDVTDPLTDREVRDILAGASDLLQSNGCNIKFTWDGHMGGFGQNRAPVSPRRKSDIIKVHKIDRGAGTDLHVKIVQDISEFCRRSRPGDTFNGCSWPIDSQSIIVVAHPRDGAPMSSLWAHELGHLMGLRHSLAPNSLMTPCPIKDTDTVVTAPECLCYLSGPGTVGECDLVHPDPPSTFKCPPLPPR